jgi:hypothetical protein
MTWMDNQLPLLQGVRQEQMEVQLRRTIADLDGANRAVISYAVTVQNLAKYIIQDVQNNRSIMQTITSAEEQLSLQVQKRFHVLRTLEVLLEIAMPLHIAGMEQLRHDALVRITSNSAARCK